MDKDNRVIRVGFIGTYSNEWIAGLNYLTNLLYAISILEDKKIKPIVFVGKKTDAKIKKQAQKLDALKESRQLMYAWEEQQKAYEQQISLYKISQGTTLDSQLSQLMKANIPQENIDVQGNVIARANDPTIQSFNAKAYDSISNPQMKGIWTKEEEDKYKSLNPFN